MIDVLVTGALARWAARSSGPSPPQTACES